MKTIQQIDAEYNAKREQYQSMGMTEEMLIQVMADAMKVRDSELAVISKANSQAIQLTPTLTVAFPLLEDTVKEDRKTKEEYQAVKGGTVNLSYRVGKGKQTSYTAYLPLDMYRAILETQEQVQDAIYTKLESGHLFKVSGVTSVDATRLSKSLDDTVKEAGFTIKKGGE